MRVSKDKTDAAYDPRDRKIFISEKQVSGNWVSADEFRRVVVMDDGKAIFGDVYIERLPELVKEEYKALANCPTEQFKETEMQFAASAPIEKPLAVPGYSMGDRVKIKDRK